MGFVIGGLGVATGVTLLLLAPGDPSEDSADGAAEEAQLEPLLGFGAVGLRGTF